MTFTFDSTGLVGKTVVVFESLMIGNVEVAAHADIGDEGQAVTFKQPKIGTTAKAENGSKTVPLAEKVTVIDTVAYENLAIGEEYVLTGTLMDKQSGQPLMNGGKPVVEEVIFTPAVASGTIEVQFTLDSRATSGRTLVVFEVLECGGTEITAHADINDEAQSVTVGAPGPAPTPEPAPTPTLQPPVQGKPVPKTGDDYMVVVWLALAGIFLPGLLISAAIVRRKKRGMAVVCILCAALLVISTFMALGEIRQYSDNTDAYNRLERFVAFQAEDGEIAPKAGVREAAAASLDEAAGVEAGSTASALPSVDFAALRGVNPDIAGWIISDGTPINYPIARGADNSRYLNHLYDGSRGKAGMPFLDFENSPGFTDRNSIVYGHNLLDGSMFSCLTDYTEQAYYNAHPTMLLLTPDGSYTVEVFAVFAASPDESGADVSPWRQVWDTEDDFGVWLEQMARRSAVQTGIAPDAGDRVLTLSTCIRGNRYRFVVMGRLIPA